MPDAAATNPSSRFGSTEREVAVIGQGTWYIENSQGGAPAAIAALRRGLDLGMTHIDTTEMYGSGTAEEIVGEAIAGRRDDSLVRLNTDRLDCYLLHWRGAEPLEDTIAAFEQREGKILSWGVSNFDGADLAEAWPTKIRPAVSGGIKIHWRSTRVNADQTAIANRAPNR